MTAQSLPPLDIPMLLRQYGLIPDKRLGQNFLIDETALKDVVEAAEVDDDSFVLEVGPGLGSMTRHLAAEAQNVVAVELDKRLLPPLRQVLSSFNNVEIVQGDILDLAPTDLMGQDSYIVAANIPYYITSAIIRHLMDAPVKPVRVVLTVQVEVAERICAGPGSLSLLALSVQVYGAARITARIPATAFYPAPKVDSAVVRMDLYDAPRIPEQDLDLFFRLAKAGFGQKRKTLLNALSSGMHWTKGKTKEILALSGIDPQRRAQTLDLEEWKRLTQQTTNKKSG
ncbi:MAG: 16S rRNA (adenine(1518)-N(6)/adenine(1519)-N(6))-dimethyltransferase RsmA [Chloroflexota bacterium]